MAKSGPKDDFVTVPNQDLSPEYSYNAEIGISRIVEGYMKIELVGYYTYLEDAIVRTGYQLNGEDSLYYDGDPIQITTNYNAGQGLHLWCLPGFYLQPEQEHQPEGNP